DTVRRGIYKSGNDFTKTSHHISVTPSDASCEVCHNRSNHTQEGDPRVRLYDEDSGAAIIYDGTGGSLEGFCISCHDSDAASRLGSNSDTPFKDSSDNTTPPDIGWDSTASAHSALTDNCFGCHGDSGGTGTTLQPVINAHGSDSPKLLRYTGWLPDDESGFCYNCHGTPPANGAEEDIQSVFSRAYPHEDRNCADCHNKHQLTQTNRIKGASGVEPYNGGFREVKITDSSEEYKVCFKCHSSYTTQPPSSAYRDTDFTDFRLDDGTPLPEGDKAVEFDPSNSSYHPVEAPGKNQSANLDAQIQWAGLSTSSVIKCTDCHNNNILGESGTAGRANNYTGSEPLGPHGSTNRWILRANYKRDLTFPRSTTFNENDFALCFSCHDKDKLLGTVWWEDGGTAQTNFWNQGHGNYSNLHWVHLIGYGQGYICADCHYNVHSNQQANNTQYYDEYTGLSSYTPPQDVPTGLVNFAPHVMRFYYNWTYKPVWGYNKYTKRRSCLLKCHRADGSDTYMNYTYTGPPSGDYQ
ncbi:MAG: hypothetical protein D6710_09505, partial [Nitrospirae bacterium]